MIVELTRRAVKDLERLERDQPGLYGKVISSISSLADDPYAGKPLVGPLKGMRSVRVGAMRVVYEVVPRLRSGQGGKRVIVLTVNHRGEVYR